jgi:heme-degrading monooxygenase HmoA
MFVHIAIHRRPKAGKEQFLIDSMHRFGAAMQGQPGFQQVSTLKDRKTGALVGLAIWDSEEALMAARPVMAEAVKDDNFEEWEDEPPEVFLLDSV